MSGATPIALRGIFPPIPTPMTNDGDVDYGHLQQNLEKWNTEPMDGYVVLGSNGEYVYLSTDERLDIIRAARDAIPPDRLLIAGAGMESTRATIGLAIRMAELGADLAIIVTPHYYNSKMTAAALEQHYHHVADACPIPIILYNVPLFTGVNIPAETVITLAKHPNIAGIKESSSDVGKLGMMLDRVPKDFQVLTGSASGFLSALAVGAVGGVMALANIASAQLACLVEHFEQGRLSEAATIQRQLIPANHAVTGHLGIPGLKAGLDMLGYYGGPVRSPLLPISETDKHTLRVILTKAGLL